MSKQFQIPAGDAQQRGASGLVVPALDAITGVPVDGAPPRPRRSPPRALLRAMRPKQWTKNVLVAAAPGGAGVLTHSTAAGKTALAFAAFCLVSSATYLFNDIGDREEDRRHPEKRDRPIAAGELSARAAAVAAVVLLIAGLGIAASLRLAFVGLLAGYLAVTLAYTVWLKHVAVFDIAVVASGFIFRAVAGGLAVDVPISRWFLIVTSFGSLFIVAGKRYSEHITMGAERETTRATLATYSRDYLRYVWTMASAVTLGGYFLWAFEQSKLEGSIPWFELSIAPFTMGILRYALLLDEGAGGAPEEIVLRDRPLQLLGLMWLIVYGAGVSVVH
ncbi:MAG TPA: decaprenyl-phosphate phosphoribosyltransferase [Solirubrobacteraceae bacterium]